jgi:chromosome segregation ATPase
MNEERLLTNYTQYSAFQTEPNRRINFKYKSTGTSPNRELSICNYNYTLVTEEDIEVINLRRKLNEIKKQRIIKEKEVILLENKVNVLQKEEQKVHSYLHSQIRKKEEIFRKKSKNKKFKTEILNAKIEMNQFLEKNRENIRLMKEKLKNSKKLQSINNKKINNAKEIYSERIKLNEKRSNQIKELEQLNKKKVRSVKLSMDFALEERRRKESLLREKFKKELEERIKEELSKKSKCDKKLNTIEKKQNEISNKVKYMSPSSVKKKLVFSSKNINIFNNFFR